MVLALDARLLASRLHGAEGEPLSDETERVGRTQPDPTRRAFVSVSNWIRPLPMQLFVQMLERDCNSWFQKRNPTPGVTGGHEVDRLFVHDPRTVRNATLILSVT